MYVEPKNTRVCCCAHISNGDRKKFHQKTETIVNKKFPASYAGDNIFQQSFLQSASLYLFKRYFLIQSNYNLSHAVNDQKQEILHLHIFTFTKKKKKKLD